MEDFIIDDYAVKTVWKNCGQYWLSTKTGKLINSDEFSDFNIPDNVTQSQFLVNMGYIPYVGVSEAEVIHAYIPTLKNKKLVQALSNIDEDSICESFWKYLNAYDEIYEGYGKFEKDYVEQKIVTWCVENGLKYEIK